MPLSFKKTLPQTKYDWDWEPDELRELKFELANLKCDCPSCGQGHLKETPTSKAIQADQRFNTSDRFIQVTPETVLQEVIRLQNSDEQIQQCMDLVCPRCMVTMNLLRARATKVVKDEEIATNTLLTFEKSTGRAFPDPVIKSLLKSEESSSIFRRPSALKSESASSNTFKDFNDLMSSLSSYDTEPFTRQRSRDRVTFLDGYQNEGNRTDRNEEKHNEKQCTCLENLIDSIRPPLIGF